MPDKYDEIVKTVQDLYKSGYIVNVNPGPPGIAESLKNEDFDYDFADDWGGYEEEEEEVPVDPNEILNHVQAESLEDGVILLDADGYAFQKRRGEWFMAGAQYGSTEFSGTFPARKMV